jgi:hypothetical protein
MKPLQARHHCNGRTGEIKLLRNGQFYAYSRAPNTPAREVSHGHEVRSLCEARQIADCMAHADCEGVGCGEWQNEHGDDPECLSALSRELSWSGVN